MGEPQRSVRVAFFALGAAFFGLALLDRALALFAGFSSLLLTLFLTWLLAFLIGPLVSSLDRRLPLGRGFAVAVAYGLVSGGIALLVIAIARIGAREATDLVGRTDEIARSIVTMVGNLQAAVGIDRSTVDLPALVDDAQRRVLPAVTQQLADQTQLIATSILSVLGTLFIVVVLSLYAVTDPESISGMLRRIVPTRHAEMLVLVQRTVGRAFRGFLRVQVVLVLIQIALSVSLGVIFGLPYLFLLTVSTALLMFIPFFGPPLALIPVVFVALAFRPDVAFIVIVLLVVTQTILVNLLQPRLLREGVGLHPILVIVALLAGAQVAGLWGALFGIPIVAIVNLLLRYVIASRVVNEAKGVDLREMVAEIQAENPEVEVEEAVDMAADRVEAMLEADAAAHETGAAAHEPRAAAHEPGASARETEAAAGT